jgi:hypothetical protein
MGQCTEFMRAKLDALKDWKGIKYSFDLIKLIKAIKGLTYKFEGHNYHAMALHQVKKSFFGLYQGRDTSDTHYLDKFMTGVSVVEQYGGCIGKDDGAIQDKLSWAGVTATLTSGGTPEQLKDAAKDKCLAIAFLSGANKARYGKLLEDLETDFTKGSNYYPSSVTSAYNLLVNYKNYQRPAS